MNIGNQMKAIKVERVGGPRQTPITTPATPAKVAVTAEKAERVLTTA